MLPVLAQWKAIQSRTELIDLLRTSAKLVLFVVQPILECNAARYTGVKVLEMSNTNP